MLISIIIVNYNVKYFLEQCLRSVEKAIQKVEAEVFVIDNNSTDNSIGYLQPKFPFVQFIYNRDNVGFAKANNQVLSACKGDYILYLNPDTIIAEDCLEMCISFFESKVDCGALGIKMIDGSGTFLPESKRGFPSPIASFFKLTGLSELFSTSKIFNQYSLGYLDPFSNHKVDVLAGAFILSKRTILQRIGGFDEAFFMYGEDIDLSYRIQQLGYNNYYFADSTILHFKGESTKKGSLNYVKMFYKAMSIFVNKHYSGSKATIFSLLIHCAILFRGCISYLKSFILKIGMPLLDAIIVFCSLIFIKDTWIYYERDGIPFSLDNFPITFLIFTLIFLIAGALAGMYDKQDRPSKTFAASVSSMIVIIAVYALLPESLWFSRGVIVLGGFFSGIAISVFRLILLKSGWIELSDEEYKFQQTAVIGTVEEYKQVYSIFKNAGLEERLLGRIKIDDKDNKAIGDIKQIRQLLDRLNIKELIFCEGTLNNYLIIQMVQTLPHNISYRFMGSKTSSIVGSDSKATTGETVAAEGFYRISDSYNKRMKRIADLLFSFYLLFSLPLQVLLINNISGLFKNIFKVIFNRATWVGYTTKEPSLPAIPNNIITCYGLPVNEIHPINAQALHHLNIQYAKNYDFMTDIKILLKTYKYLGG